MPPFPLDSSKKTRLYSIFIFIFCCASIDDSTVVCVCVITTAKESWAKSSWNCVVWWKRSDSVRLPSCSWWSVGWCAPPSRRTWHWSVTAAPRVSRRSWSSACHTSAPGCHRCEPVPPGSSGRLVLLTWMQISFRAISSDVNRCQSWAPGNSGGQADFSASFHEQLSTPHLKFPLAHHRPVEIKPRLRYMCFLWTLPEPRDEIWGGKDTQTSKSSSPQITNVTAGRDSNPIKPQQLGDSNVYNNTTDTKEVSFSVLVIMFSYAREIFLIVEFVRVMRLRRL